MKFFLFWSFFLLLISSLVLTLLMITNKLYFKFSSHNLPYVTPDNFEYLNNAYKVLNLLVNAALIYFQWYFGEDFSFFRKFSLRSFVHLRILLFFATYNAIYTVFVRDKFLTKFDLWASMLYDDLFCLSMIVVRMNIDFQLPEAKPRALMFLGLFQLILVCLYNLLVSFIEADTLFISNYLYARVFFAVYTYCNNFFMSKYIIDFFGQNPASWPSS